MKKNIKLFLHLFRIIICSLLLVNCTEKENQPKPNLVFTFKVMTLQYDHTRIDSIKNNESFILDDKTIIHKDNFTSNNNPFCLPSSKPTLASVGGKKLEEKVNIVTMGIILSEKIKYTNEYNLINLRQTNINGKITLSRKDGKDITLKIKKSYPLLVNNYSK